MDATRPTDRLILLGTTRLPSLSLPRGIIFKLDGFGGGSGGEGLSFPCQAARWEFDHAPLTIWTISKWTLFLSFLGEGERSKRKGADMRGLGGEHNQGA